MSKGQAMAQSPPYFSSHLVPMLWVFGHSHASLSKMHKKTKCGLENRYKHLVYAAKNQKILYTSKEVWRTKINFSSFIFSQACLFLEILDMKLYFTYIIILDTPTIFFKDKFFCKAHCTIIYSIIFYILIN
jgi:hypothetical protein